MSTPRISADSGNLTYGLDDAAQKAIESKFRGRSIKNWLLPSGGIISIILAAGFVTAIITVAKLKPSFEATPLGIGVGSTSGILFLISGAGGFILIARHGHTAYTRQKELNKLVASVKNVDAQDKYIVNVLKDYQKISENDRIDEEKDWLVKLRAALKERVRTHIDTRGISNLSDQQISDFKKDFIDLPKFVFEDFVNVENGNLRYEYIAARAKFLNALFPDALKNNFSRK